MASNAVVLLFWPLGFFHAHLQRYWAKDRFTIFGVDERNPLGFISKLSRTQIFAGTLNEALSRAEKFASTANENVYIEDSAKYDKNVLGQSLNRLYLLAPTGDVRIINKATV